MPPLRLWAELGLAVLLASAVALGWHWRGQRDDLRAAVSIAAHAADRAGRPATLSTRDAIAQARILGQAVDDMRLASARATAADAEHALTVERADARTIEEITTDVHDQLAQVRDALADSRALAARRLRELEQARADSGGGGAAAEPADPDATCRAAFAATCDEVLAFLAEAEGNTARLVGWQKFWAGVKANHNASSPDGGGVSAE